MLVQLRDPTAVAGASPSNADKTSASTVLVLMVNAPASQSGGAMLATAMLYICSAVYCKSRHVFDPASTTCCKHEMST